MGNFWVIFIFLIASNKVHSQYQANWTSLDSRPLPLWYDQAKFGIFTHWGVYSVPSFRSEWFWEHWKGSDPRYSEPINQFMATHYKPNTTYADFAASFSAVDFNATVFAEIVKSSGAKYFVLTTKHHEGFTLWPSDVSWNWNAKDVGPGRDLVGEIQEAILNVGGIRWGTYISLLDWYHPFYLMDKANNGSTTVYADEIFLPQVYDLVNTYKPDILWGDGDWDFSYTYWKSQEFMAWLYNESPVKDTVVTNDRWGAGAMCHHGGYYTCTDNYDPGVLQPHKWENCDSIDQYSWGFRRSIMIDQVISLKDFIIELVTTISTGGNLLMNIGPDHNGNIATIFQERLRDIGYYVNAHSEAIFSTKPWIWQNDSDSTVWYTSQVRNNATLDPYRLYNNQTQANTIIYAFIVDWPDSNLVNLSRILPTSQTTVNVFTNNGSFIQLAYTQPFDLSGGIQVNIGGISLKKFPSHESFVLKIEYAADQNVNPLG